MTGTTVYKKMLQYIRRMEPTRPIEDAGRLLFLRGCNQAIVTLLDPALLRLRVLAEIATGSRHVLRGMTRHNNRLRHLARKHFTD